MKFFRAIALLIAAVLLAGCGAVSCGGQQATTTPEPTKVAMPGAGTVAPPATSVAAVSTGPTQAPTTAPTATSAPAQALGFSIPNPLEEVRKLWPKAELPVKETMFLGGYILGPLEPFLGCLRIFGYFFAVVYCLVAVQWQVNHRDMSWQEFLDDFLLGSPGKMIFIVSLVAAPLVYLTSLHDIAVAFWWTDNSFIREALGWKLVGFSPDLDPESMLELLKWLPEWVALHIVQEVFLLVGFIFAVVLAGLKRNLAPLRIWGVAYLMYFLYGVAVFSATTFVDSVRATELVGNNFVWSSFVRINKMFVYSTKGLWYLMAYIIPFFYAIYELFFASKQAVTAGSAKKRSWSSEDVLNVFQTLLLWLGMTNRPPAEDGAWPMWAPNHPQQRNGPRQLPDGRDRNVPPAGGSPGGSRPTGDRGGKQQSNPRGTASPSSVPGASPRGGSGRTTPAPSAGLWRILPADHPAEQGEAVTQQVSSHNGEGNRARQPGQGVLAAPGIHPASAGATSTSLPGDRVEMEDGATPHRQPAVLAGDSTVPEARGKAETSVVGVAEGGEVVADSPSAESDRRLRVKTDDGHQPPPRDEATLPESSMVATAAPNDAEQTVTSDQHSGNVQAFQVARMKEKFGDLESGELVLVRIGADGKAITIDGTEIPLEQLSLETDEEGGAG